MTDSALPRRTAIDRATRPRATATALPSLLVGVAAIAYLIWRPPSLDLAAAAYRAALFGHTGFAIWDVQWYGGHYLPAYSLLVPAVSWLFGAQFFGACAVVAATAIFQRLVRARDATALLAATWFGFGALASLISGRVTFTDAIPIALGALLLDRAGPRTLPRAAGVLALSAATALFSPVASLFIAVAWTALLITRRDPFYLHALVATFTPIVVLNLAFPEIGDEPLPFSALRATAIGVVVLLALARDRRSTLSVGLVVYLAACLLSWLLHTPVGGNVLRLGPLCAGPVALLTLRSVRRPWLAAVVVAALAWQWSDAIHDVVTARRDPSVAAGYYRPLLGYLDRSSGPAGQAADGGFRVEIPFTRVHWEARWVAPRYGLARGWERQADRADNALFYRPGLTAAAYERWLHDDAVRYVALPDVALDPSARRERQIIDSHPAFLVPVWSSRHWRVFRVAGAVPLLQGPGRLRSLRSDAIALTSPPGARERLRVRWNPYWTVEAGSGCVVPAGRWTQITATTGGVVRLGERFSMARIGSHHGSCTG